MATFFQNPSHTMAGSGSNVCGSIASAIYRQHTPNLATKPADLADKISDTWPDKIQNPATKSPTKHQTKSADKMLHWETWRNLNIIIRRIGPVGRPGARVCNFVVLCGCTFCRIVWVYILSHGVGANVVVWCGCKCCRTMQVLS